MKMYKFLLQLAACGVLMASCAEVQETAPITQGKVTFEVPDFEEEALADTRMDVKVSSSGATFKWSEGDTLGVIPDEGYQTAFPISDGTGTSSAEFDGGAWALRASVDYAAYYPFQHPMDAVNKRAIAVSYVGQCQLGNNNTAHLGGYDYLAAPFTTVSANGNTTFTFAHMGALVRLRLYVPTADTYSFVTLKSNGAKFVTAGTIDLTSASPKLATIATSNEVTLDLTGVNSKEADELITLYMMVAPANLSSAQIAVTLAGATKNYLGNVTGKNYEAGIIYSHTVELEVESSGPDFNGHEYVDLGLPSGLLWATMNIGASKPEEYGKYYAWGEIKAYGEEDKSNATNYRYAGSYTKKYYHWNTYKYCNGTKTSMTKYCTKSEYGTVDNKTELEMSDDAASVIWGGDWRLPTYEEFAELYNNCTSEWTTLNNVKGRLFVGPNGNTFFFPAASYCIGSYIIDAGVHGYYWSRSLNKNFPFSVGRLDFNPDGVEVYDDGNRFDGRTIRAVCGAK